MSRMEVISNLANCEQRLQQFKALLADTNDYYFKKAHITVSLETTAYDSRREYHDGSLQVDNKLFREYIECEIDKLEDHARLLISQLVEGE
jgi:hypothetical protein